jgi:hypothetical protein
MLDNQLYEHLDEDYTRPDSDDGWKQFFSEHIEKKSPEFPSDGNTVKRYKTKKPAPDFNPFRMAKQTDADVAAHLNTLLGVMDQSRAKLNTDRRSNNPAIRALVVTTVPWSLATKAKRRDWMQYACWALLETYWAKSYRRTLFKNVQIAGIIREDLSNLYRPFIVSDQMVLTTTGGTAVSDDFPWYDMMIPTQSPADTETAISIEEVKRDRDASDMRIKYDKELRKIASIVQKASVAHNISGPSDTVDGLVVRHLSRLLRVSSYLISSLTPFLMHCHRLLSTMRVATSHASKQITWSYRTSDLRRISLILTCLTRMTICSQAKLHHRKSPRLHLHLQKRHRRARLQMHQRL